MMRARRMAGREIAAKTPAPDDRRLNAPPLLQSIGQMHSTNIS
jgi:hypothetical protein